MKPSNQLIIAGVLVVLALIGFGLVNREVIKPETTPTPTERPKFFGDTLAADITEVEIVDNNTKDVFAAVLKADGTWAITKGDKTKDTGLGIDQARIINAVAVLPVMVATTSLTTTDLSAYGLDKPAYTMTLKIKKKDVTIQIGSQNPDKSDYYILSSGSPDVSLVGAYNFSALIEFLTDPPYAKPTPNPNETPSLTPEPSATPTATSAATSAPASTPTP